MRFRSGLIYTAALAGFACVETALASANSLSSLSEKLEYQTAVSLQLESVDVIANCRAHAVYLKRNVPESRQVNQNYRIWQLAASQKYLSPVVSEDELSQFSMRVFGHSEDASRFKHYEKTSLRCQRLWMGAYKSSYEKALNSLGLESK